VAGGFQVDKVMDSRSTYLKAGLGGFHGRALKKGDLLLIKEQEEQYPLLKRTNWYVSSDFHPAIKEENIIRVTVGKQFDLFSTKSNQDFSPNLFTFNIRFSCRYDLRSSSV
jgi:antagonist of KipI